MNRIKVIWQSYHKKTPNRGYWDQAILEHLFAGKLWKPNRGHEFVHINGFKELPDFYKDGAIVVIPARYHAEDINKINRDIEKLKWVIVILTGDEEAVFPSEKLEHPNMIIYAMTPRKGKHLNVDRFIVNGWPTDTRKHLKNYEALAEERPLRWFFAGQITHARRQSCAKIMRNMEGGKLIETPGFTQGVSHEEYFKDMASAKVVPCPSGPETPETFRVYEALESGCFPIVDDRTPNDEKRTNYWKYLFDLDELPFETISDWRRLKGIVDYHNDVWPRNSNKVFAWWQQFKRQFVYNLEADINHLTKEKPPAMNYQEKITVLIPTSPIKRHPDTAIIEETINRVREQLPKSEIFIMIDGVREEQQDYQENYQKYIQKLLWKCNHQWQNILPIVFSEHHHQAAMTRETLKQVHTPTILFVEHDTPIFEYIDWGALTEAIIRGDANMIRLHHEALILEEHKHLMLDEAPQDLYGAPMIRTAQWSQRPHLASTNFYMELLDKYFSHEARTMIEDRIHGVVHEAYMNKGKAGWNRFKTWVYAPPGDMKRSGHLDGREGDPKYEMVF